MKNIQTLLLHKVYGVINEIIYKGTKWDRGRIISIKCKKKKNLNKGEGMCLVNVKMGTITPVSRI